jgi:hypothetical protein
MELYILSGPTDKYKVYSSKDKLLRGYIKICKEYYSNYERETRGKVRELKEYFTEISPDHGEDLINFIQEKEYKGIFTLDELRNVDLNFTFQIGKLDE